MRLTTFAQRYAVMSQDGKDRRYAVIGCRCCETSQAVVGCWLRVRNWAAEETIRTGKPLSDHAVPDGMITVRTLRARRA